ncbi:hypothetical protein C8F04DRAFT_1367826 [Mycena alexandri]|uniref:Uncharacterized protein n=1 Tax=Mycena alexandri TaxID=1745969 RepID=A0AAD6WYV0_9AGAR|nr:hypothetical protein C8F04DRAFT_1367826 [Mycena alexandri]
MPSLSLVYVPQFEDNKFVFEDGYGDAKGWDQVQNILGRHVAAKTSAGIWYIFQSFFVVSLGGTEIADHGSSDPTLHSACGVPHRKSTGRRGCGSSIEGAGTHVPRAAWLLELERRMRSGIGIASCGKKPSLFKVCLHRLRQWPPLLLGDQPLTSQSDEGPAESPQNHLPPTIARDLFLVPESHVRRCLTCQAVGPVPPPLPYPSLRKNFQGGPRPGNSHQNPEVEAFDGGSGLEPRVAWIKHTLEPKLPRPMILVHLPGRTECLSSHVLRQSIGSGLLSDGLHKIHFRGLTSPLTTLVTSPYTSACLPFI